MFRDSTRKLKGKFKRKKKVRCLLVSIYSLICAPQYPLSCHARNSSELTTACTNRLENDPFQSFTQKKALRPTVSRMVLLFVHQTPLSEMDILRKTSSGTSQAWMSRWPKPTTQNGRPRSVFHQAGPWKTSGISNCPGGSQPCQPGALNSSLPRPRWVGATLATRAH